MSSINVNTIKSRLGGPPTLPSGVVVSAAATFNSDVSIGGTLTYEDVTNVDVVGLITARGGLEIGAAGVGGTITSVGNAELVGIVTAAGGLEVGAAGVGGTISSGGNVIFAGITTVGTALSLADNIKASFGNSNDLQIYHDASNAFIANNGSGDFYIQGGNVKIRNVAGSANLAQFVQSGKVGLFFNGSEKFETTTSGVSVAGTTILTNTGDFITYDNGKFKSGNGAEVSLWHNNTATLGENGYLRNLVGNLNINSGNSAGNIYINLDENVAGVTSDRAASFNRNGSVDLYYDNYKKFETLSTGVKVTGVTSTTSFSVGPGLIQEEFDNYGTALTGTYNHDVVDHGMILYAYSNASASFVLNLRGDGSTTLNSLMHIGQSSVFTAYTGSNNTSYYMTDFQIDGSSQTEEWNGGSAPTAGTGSGYDVYTFNILKTADATFKVFANFSNFN